MSDLIAVVSPRNGAIATRLKRARLVQVIYTKAKCVIGRKTTRSIPSTTAITAHFVEIACKVYLAIESVGVFLFRSQNRTNGRRPRLRNTFNVLEASKRFSAR